MVNSIVKNKIKYFVNWKIKAEMFFSCVIPDSAVKPLNIVFVLF